MNLALVLCALCMFYHICGGILISVLVLNNKTSKVDIDKLTVNDIDEFLDTKGIKDPDLLIRTSGELRLSNFLLWQIAYSELYFTDVLWPEFTIDEYYKAIYSFNLRDRRYGGRNNK